MNITADIWAVQVPVRQRPMSANLQLQASYLASTPEERALARSRYAALMEMISS